MADWVQNNAKGRVAELHNRVDGNDPSTSVIVLVPLSTQSSEAVTQDTDELTAFLATAANEQTEGGWVRKVLTDADVVAAVVDDVNNRFPAAVPEVKWTGPTTGKDTAGLAVCYDPKAGEGADTEIIVLTVHAFAVTADGNDVILNAGDYFRAS